MFLESSRFPTNLSFQRPGGATFNTDVQVLESGHEQRNSYWPVSRTELELGFSVRTLEEVQTVNEIFRACRGMAHGFRIRDWRNYKSVPITWAGPEDDVKADEISADDQVISIDTTTQDIFQLIYTSRFGVLYERKTITKPERISDGVYNVLLAIAGIPIPSNRYDIDSVPARLAAEAHETVGTITLAANVQKSISNITQAAAAVVTTTTSHGLSINDSVHFSSVAGMTQINGKRGLITAVGGANQFTVVIDSSAFTAYTSGGTINTRRQSTSFAVAIAGITKQRFAKVTSSGAHGLVAGDVGVFSGVSGMTEINTLTATVLEVIDSTHFRIDINTLSFGTFGGGGSLAVAERVTAGYVYDLPVRFDTDHIPLTFEAWRAAGVDLKVVELRLV
jgi:uncharacterized protein (TIGR02217 family)